MSFAVIIHGWDPYSWCWELTNKAFQKFWDWKLKVPVYFLTCELDPKFDNITTLKCGKGEWSDRLRFALNTIPEDNILYLQEDMNFFKPVDGFKLMGLFDTFKQYNMDVLRMEGAGPYYKMKPTNISFDGGVLQKLEPDSDYLISHQPSFWKKQFFLNNLTVSEQPYNNEVLGTNRIRGTKNEIYFYQKDWYLHLIHHGKFIENSLKTLKEVLENEN